MLRGYDKTGALLGEIDFIEASWDRKWSQPGEFMVYMALDEYRRLNNLGLKYIENLGRPEIGVIQKIEYSKESNGAFETVSGFFAENLLNYATYRKTQVISANSSAAVKSGITNYIANANAPISADGNTYKPLKNIVIDGKSVFPSKTDVSIDNTFFVGEAIYSILSGTDYGVRVSISEYPKEDNTGALSLSILFVKGNNLTEGDNAVYFGKAYNNVDEASYTLDESAEKCLYEIVQAVEPEAYNAFSSTYFPIKYTETIEGDTKYYVGCTYFYKGNQPSDIGACYPKNILTTALSSDECDLSVTTTANQQKIRDLMQKKAQLDMLDNYKVESISVDVLQEKYTYMKDYDLGDTCVVLIDDLEQMYYARIEEVNETHKNNMIEIQLVLGTPSKQKWRR